MGGGPRSLLSALLLLTLPHAAAAPPPAPAGFSIEIGRLHPPPPLDAIDGLALRCDDLRLSADALHCAAGSLEWADSAHGTQRLDATFSYGGGEWSFTIEGQRLSFADAAGLVAGEGVAGRVELTVRREGEGWRLAGEVVRSAGELYVEPIYWDPAAPAVALHFDLSIHDEAVTVHHVAWNEPGIGQGEGSGRLVAEEGTWRPESATLRMREVELAPFYRRYVQPAAVGHDLLGELEAAGRLVELELRMERGRLTAAELLFDDLHLDDKRERFGIYALNGRVGWAGPGEGARRTALDWQGGYILALDIGPASIEAVSEAGRLRLDRPLTLPLLDGELMVDSFDFSLDETGEPQWELDAILTPVSMGVFTHAVGWPAMSGRLSGVIPKLSYRDGTATVQGDLLARMFDGEVLVRNLRVEHPLGRVNRLYADVEIRRLDLDELTRTFSFGTIEGRVSGRIDDLELEQWRPVAFMARLETPPDDDSRHRISQQAVENLSQVGGGGVGGVLSRSFMRFFENFSYDRIGLSCILADGVCRMEGVAPAGEGYYIVKGGGLPPRIDVIGYAHRVDWQELVNRLQGITLGDPLIKGGGE